jgi:hypothetical protein
MNAIYPLSVHRRIERHIKSLKQIYGQFFVATERMLQRAFKNDSLLIPVAVRTVVDRRRLDQFRPRD